VAPSTSRVSTRTGSSSASTSRVGRDDGRVAVGTGDRHDDVVGEQVLLVDRPPVLQCLGHEVGLALERVVESLDQGVALDDDEKGGGTDEDGENHQRRQQADPGPQGAGHEPAQAHHARIR